MYDITEDSGGDDKFGGFADEHAFLVGTEGVEAMSM